MPRRHHPLRSHTVAHILEIAPIYARTQSLTQTAHYIGPHQPRPCTREAIRQLLLKGRAYGLIDYTPKHLLLSTTYTHVAVPIRRIDCHPPPGPYYLPRPRERGQHASPAITPEFDASATPASQGHLSCTRPAPPQTSHTSGVSRPCGPFGIPSQYDENGPRNPHPLHSDSSLLGRHHPISNRSSDPAAYPCQSHGWSTDRDIRKTQLLRAITEHPVVGMSTLRPRDRALIRDLIREHALRRTTVHRIHIVAAPGIDPTPLVRSLLQGPRQQSRRVPLTSTTHSRIRKDAILGANSFTQS